jgi:hypothetical protein
VVSTVKCAQCGALIDPLAHTCQYCRFTTPAGVAAHQRAEYEQRAQAQYQAHAQYQHQVVEQRRASGAANQALIWSIVGIVLCCTPLAIVGVVMGARARGMATRAGLPVPTTATAGLALGVFGVLSSLAFVIYMVVDIGRKTERRDARVAELEARLGDRPSAETLEHDTACGLAEVYVLRNGWGGTSGEYLQRFDCAGKLIPGEERAELDDLRFEGSTESFRANVCFRRGAKWYVTELRDGECEL